MDFTVGMKVITNQTSKSYYHGQIGVIIEVYDSYIKVQWPDKAKYRYPHNELDPAHPTFTPIDCPSFDEIMRQHE